MISVKCPACGLVDWNDGDCKRGGPSRVGLGREGEGRGYVPGVSEWAADARAVRHARRVAAVCGTVVLGLVVLGVIYVVNKPAKRQWFWSFYRKEPTVGEIFEHNLEVSGGAERIRKLSGFWAEGRLKFVGGEAARAAAAVGDQVTFVMHVKSPNKTEMEIEMGPAPTGLPVEARLSAPAYAPFALFAAQTTGSLRRGFDGTKGWAYVERTTLTAGSTVPIKQYSSRELDGDALERMKRSAQASGLVRLGDEDTSLKLAGREAAAGGIG